MARRPATTTESCDKVGIFDRRVRASARGRRGLGRSGDGRSNDLVVEPEPERRQQPDAGNRHPNESRLLPDLTEMMEQQTAKPSADERPNADRKKEKPIYVPCRPRGARRETYS